MCVCVSIGTMPVCVLNTSVSIFVSKCLAMETVCVSKTTVCVRVCVCVCVGVCICECISALRSQ